MILRSLEGEKWLAADPAERLFLVAGSDMLDLNR